MVVNLKTEKRPARSVASIYKDHHYGFEVPVQESRRRLIPLIHEISKGVYHRDGLHPGDESNSPLFVLRSCRSKSSWCKRRLQASEVLSMYDISDSVTKSITDKLRSKIIPAQRFTWRGARIFKRGTGGGGDSRTQREN
jgi:hypothetical protein